MNVTDASSAFAVAIVSLAATATARARGRRSASTIVLVVATLGAALAFLHGLLTTTSSDAWRVGFLLPALVATNILVAIDLLPSLGRRRSTKVANLLIGTVSTVVLVWQLQLVGSGRSVDVDAFSRSLFVAHAVSSAMFIVCALLATLAIRGNPRSDAYIGPVVLAVVGVLGLLEIESLEGWGAWFAALVVAKSLVFAVLVAEVLRSNSLARNMESTTARVTARWLVVFLPTIAICLIAIGDDTSSPGTRLVAAALAILVVLLIDRIDADAGTIDELDDRVARSEGLGEQAIAHGRLLYSRIVQVSTDAIVATDSEMRVIEANPAASQILERPHEEIVGRPIMEVTRISRPGPTAEQVRDHLLQNPTNDVLVPVEIDGREKILEISTRPLDGQRFGSLVIFRDVTERESLTKFKDDIISIVSHELRTPLTAIRGALGLLIGGAYGPIDEALAPVMKVALENSERLGRIVDDLLDVERFRSGRETLSLETITVDSLFARLMRSVSPLAQANGMSIRAQPSSESLRIDANRILQVLTNLVQNAVKFSPAASVIELTSSSDATGHVLSVTDQGSGIPPDEIARVFEPFHRVDTGDSSPKNGIGLGLAISSAIVRAHGGRIWASSPRGGGTTISFFVPRHPENSTDQNQGGPLELSMIGVSR